jgi:hypothetical protein
MAMTQPVLSADQWKATVTKMKDVYKAPVADKDIPAIVDYLTAMSAAQDGAPTGRLRIPPQRAGCLRRNEVEAPAA